MNLRPDRPDLLLLLPQLPLQLEQLLQLVAEQSCKEKYEHVESEKRAQNDPRCALLTLSLSLIMFYGTVVAIGSNIRR